MSRSAGSKTRARHTLHPLSRFSPLGACGPTLTVCVASFALTVPICCSLSLKQTWPCLGVTNTEGVPSQRGPSAVARGATPPRADELRASNTPGFRTLRRGRNANYLSDSVLQGLCVEVMVFQNMGLNDMISHHSFPFTRFYAAPGRAKGAQVAHTPLPGAARGAPCRGPRTLQGSARGCRGRWPMATPTMAAGGQQDTPQGLTLAALQCLRTWPPDYSLPTPT